MVIVILTVLSGGPFANPIGQMTEVGREHPEKVQVRTLRGTLLRVMRNCGYEICKNRLDSSVKTRPSIVRRQSEM